MTQAVRHRIFWIWLASCLLHGLILALAVFTTAFQGTPFEAFGITAVMVPYLLHHAGLPVLQNGGLSGWGMSSPNFLGWLLSALAWFAAYWLVATGLERLARR